MKKSITLLCIAIGMLAFTNNLKAQAFGGKGSKQFQIGIGLTQHDTWYPTNGTGPKGHVKPRAGVVQFQMEFGIHKYIGIGVNLGVSFAKNIDRSVLGIGGILFAYNDYNAFWSVSIPVGVYSNFHFYQLIADKSGKNMHADKLDVYAGLSLGSGPAFAIAKKDYKAYGNDVGYMIFGGPHVGARFFPKEKMGFYLEAGYGKAYVNGGIVFNL